MKAVIYEKFGPPEVLKVVNDFDIPVPDDNELLIKVYATTVNAADCNIRGLTYIPPGLGLVAKLMLGFNKPKIKITGSVAAGIVEQVGKNIIGFKVGDKVYRSWDTLGAYAEYVCTSEKGSIGLMPNNISFELAATIPYGALTALYFLKNKANIKAGQKIMIVGASGGVGSFAVQLATYFGAEVTAVCSAANIDFVTSLGAKHVIDYNTTDPSKTSQKWDIVFDTVVGRTSFSRYKKSILPYGYYIAVAGGIGDMFQMLITGMFGNKKVLFGGGSECEIRENIDFITELIEKGIIKPYADRIFTLDNIVAAHKYVESGNKKGNIAVSVVN